MTTLNPHAPSQPLKTYASGSVIVGPWPSYSAFRELPEGERWLMYSGAKAHREMLEQVGFVMSEAYDDFVQRVMRELDL